MSKTQKLVCLAASRKPGGLCIAGKKVLPSGKTGNWIRPVSSRAGSEIDVEEMNYENGDSPQLLDIIAIEMLSEEPNLHQRENQLIDPSRYWEKRDVASWAEVVDMCDNPTTLWTNGSSTYHGRFDRVAVADAASLTSSLFLIQPATVKLHVLTPGEAFGNPKRAVRAEFVFRGVEYNFQVTDPVAERVFKAKENGVYELEQEVFFCVSLAEAHTDNYCYKLVAAIISEEPLS